MKILAVKPELCTGCGICEKVCSQTFFKEENPEKSAIRIGERSLKTGHYVITVCNQLGACIDVCPVKVLSRNKKGVVIRNKKLCVGCYACVGFCPNLAMFTHQTTRNPSNAWPAASAPRHAPRVSCLSLRCQTWHHPKRKGGPSKSRRSQHECETRLQSSGGNGLRTGPGRERLHQSNTLCQPL